MASVLTQHNDAFRTGANLDETILNTSNVNVTQFGKLFSRTVDGQIYAQPLYVPSLPVPNYGVRNVVFVCTEHNSVFAFDADDPSAAAPLWQVNLGPSALSWADLLPEIGITSTPVIDIASSTIYVVAETLELGASIFRLHALDLATGREKLNGPVLISGSVPGTGTDSVGGMVEFNPTVQLQRPGLLLSQGIVYIAFGSHSDTPVFHGWVFGYSAATLEQLTMFCTSPDADSSGVWQGGVGLAADATGYIYLETGNGTLDAYAGGRDYGDSVVKLSYTANGLVPVDYFSPSDQAELSAGDGDLGSGGPALLIPGSSMGIGGGKDGRLFLFDTNNLGKFNPSDNNANAVQWWKATSGHFFGGNAYYNSNLYIWGTGDVAKVFMFSGSGFKTTAASRGTIVAPAQDVNQPALSVSANGTAVGSAILWAAYSSNGLADGNPYPGVLRAFDASNLSRELWNSNQNPGRDSSGSWAKWCPPTIANGKVYLATFDGVLNVYGLLPMSETPALLRATGGTPQKAVTDKIFGAPLKAIVTSFDGSPVINAAVTFVAPAGGPTATFGAAPTATVLTDITGVATSPALIANGLAGDFVVNAAVAGLGGSAQFQLSNSVSPSVAATGGTPQSTPVGTLFSTPLQITVRDATGDPLSGVTVVFTTPTSGPSAVFGGSASATSTTGANGIASTPGLTANSAMGTFVVKASTMFGSATFILTNTEGPDKVPEVVPSRSPASCNLEAVGTPYCEHGTSTGTPN